MSVRVNFEFGKDYALSLNVGPDATFESLRSRFYEQNVKFRHLLPADPAHLFLTAPGSNEPVSTTHKLSLLTLFFSSKTFRLSTKLSIYYINGHRIRTKHELSGHQVYTDRVWKVLSQITSSEVQEKDAIIKMGDDYFLQPSDTISRFLEQTLRRGKIIELSIVTFSASSSSSSSSLTTSSFAASWRKTIVTCLSVATVLITLFMSSTSVNEGLLRVLMSLVWMVTMGTTVTTSSPTLVVQTNSQGLIPSVFSSQT